MAQGVSIKDEAATLTDQFMSSLENNGDIRKVDPELLHPLLRENPPCALVPFVATDLCRALSAKDRSDYSLAVLNVVWFMYEYQLSLPRPAWFRGARGQDDAVNVFPPEVREL